MPFKFLNTVALGSVAATAVAFGFGPAFVDNAVAYPIVAYVGGLTALMFGRTGSSHAEHPLTRLMLGLLISVSVLASLRTWAFFVLPWGEFATSGHSPYFALPAVTLSVTLVLALVGLVARRESRLKPATQVPAEG